MSSHMLLIGSWQFRTWFQNHITRPRHFILHTVKLMHVLVLSNVIGTGHWQAISHRIDAMVPLLPLMILLRVTSKLFCELSRTGTKLVLNYTSIPHEATYHTPRICNGILTHVPMHSRIWIYMSCFRSTIE